MQLPIKNHPSQSAIRPMIVKPSKKKCGSLNLRNLYIYLSIYIYIYLVHGAQICVFKTIDCIIYPQYLPFFLLPPKQHLQKSQIEHDWVQKNKKVPCGLPHLKRSHRDHRKSHDTYIYIHHIIYIYILYLHVYI